MSTGRCRDAYDRSAWCMRIHMTLTLTVVAAVATLNDIRTMFQSLLSEYEYWVDESWVSVSMFAPSLARTSARDQSMPSQGHTHP